MYYNYIYLDPRKPGKYQYSNLNFSLLFEPFYVGKGSNSRFLEHLYDKRKNYKTNKIKVIRKNYDMKDYIIKLNFSNNEEKIYQLEKDIIHIIGCLYLKTGPLTNMSIGGSGGPINRGKDNYMYGKTHTSEAKKKISDSKKKLTGELHPFFGKLSKLKNRTYDEILGTERSREVRKQQSDIAKKNKPFKKYKIIDNDFNIFYNNIVFCKYCKIMNFPHTSLNSNINKGPIKKPYRKGLGWEIMETHGEMDN